MKYSFPDHDVPLDEAWLEPLFAISEVISGEPAYQFFDVGDFMVMAKVVRSSRPNITQYKHYYTRRYLHLEVLGTPYRFIPPTTLEGSGRFVRAASLEWALDAVNLWELPWRKPGLEKYCFGLSFDDRWRLNPRFDPRRFLVDEVHPEARYAEDWSLDDPVATRGSGLRLLQGGTGQETSCDEQPF